MREGQFIKQNKDRWAEYEQPTDDPDEMAKRFTNLVDDLSYAKTFYPFSNTVTYLNGIASNIYLSIFRNKKESARRLITFWTEELPITIRRHHRTLLFSFFFFSVFVAMGAFSGAYDQTFVRAVLGDSYVDTTEHNIATGDPFNIYKKDNEFRMFMDIARNNIGVSFNCFILGFLCSVGTLYFLFNNGLMIGAFEQFFFKHGLGAKSILVVFCHGTLEISAMVISGCAGLVLGNSILFPKTYTRMQSIRRGAKDGLKIMIGLIPVFAVAAFFESFVTRHTEMPVALSITILAGSLFFILFYFVWYPIVVSRRLPHLYNAQPE